MPVDPDAPADTSMMRIVHSALRRDLAWTRALLTDGPPPDRRRRAAIGRHLAWVMAFLEAHHRSEDEGLYPLVRRRDPSAAALLDAMAGDHAAVAEAIVGLERSALSCAGSGDLGALVQALDALTDVLLPHLQREEDEAMPIVSHAITNAEWLAIEQTQNLDGKSIVQLGLEGHWLIDGADADDRAAVLRLVPLVPRLILLHGFGPVYRRRRRACAGPSRRRVQTEGSTAIDVPTEIDALWQVVRDPTRVGEWSHECVWGQWVGEATEARPGARFRGKNKQGPLRWGRLCEVVSATPYELVWRTVPTRLYPDSTRWAIRLTALATGTRIEQTFQVVKGSSLESLYATIIPAHRDRAEALEHDLERLAARADDDPLPAPHPL